MVSLNIPPWKLFRWFRRPQLWATGDWHLHHNNVPARGSHLMLSILVKHQITQVTQTCYSPGLMLCDFWLFPKLNSPLKVKRFQIVDEIPENIKGQLMAIPTKDFAEWFEQWRRCWENYVRSQGAYTEGDWGVIVLCTIFLCLVSSSINVSTFHSAQLDTFWTDLYTL